MVHSGSFGWGFGLLVTATVLNILATLLALLLSNILVYPPQFPLPRMTYAQVVTGLAYLHLTLSLAATTSPGGLFSYNSIVFTVYLLCIWHRKYKRQALLLLASSFALDAIVGFVLGSRILEHGSDHERFTLALQLLSLLLKPVSMVALVFFSVHPPLVTSSGVRRGSQPPPVPSNSSAAPSKRQGPAPTPASGQGTSVPKPASGPVDQPLQSQEGTGPTEPRAKRKRKKKKDRPDTMAADTATAGDILDALGPELEVVVNLPVVEIKPEETKETEVAGKQTGSHAPATDKADKADKVDKIPVPETPVLVATTAPLDTPDNVDTVENPADNLDNVDDPVVEAVSEDLIFGAASSVALDIDFDVVVNPKAAPKRRARQERRAVRELEQLEATDDLAPLAPLVGKPKGRRSTGGSARVRGRSLSPERQDAPRLGSNMGQSMDDLSQLDVTPTIVPKVATPTSAPTATLTSSARPKLRRSSSLSNLTDDEPNPRPKAASSTVTRSRTASFSEESASRSTPTASRPRAASTTLTRSRTASFTNESASRSRAGSMTGSRSRSGSTRSLRHTEAVPVSTGGGCACPQCGRVLADRIVVEIHLRNCQGTMTNF